MLQQCQPVICLENAAGQAVQGCQGSSAVWNI
jgi:hypothetical protein